MSFKQLGERADRLVENPEKLEAFLDEILVHSGPPDRDDLLLLVGVVERQREKITSAARSLRAPGHLVGAI